MAKMESSNQKMDEESSTVSIAEIVASSIVEKLHKLRSKPYGYRVCIYKVPEKFRKVNEDAYTPRLASIGPLHHGKIHLQAMEDYKLRCLDSFLGRFQVNLNHAIDCITELKSYVRSHYPDNITELSPEVFSEMILLDGIFILELFLKNYFPEMRDMDDEIFMNQWMRNDLLHDMMLLENQLPLIVPKELFKFVERGGGGALLPTDFQFLDLAHKYFKDVGNTANLPLLVTSDLYEVLHLVHFLRILHSPSLPRLESLHRGTFEYARSAIELQEAGVKFKMGKESCLFEILFKYGVLTIPRLRVNEWTETFFRNLIAFEQCQRQPYKDISSYIILMDSLINTPQDVDLLVKYGIIENLLGESQQVADLFNNLYKETITDSGNFYFAGLCDDLNKYSRDYWHQWKAAWFKWKSILRRDYFGNPWTIISVIAAAVLLILTLLQTIFTIK